MLLVQYTYTRQSLAMSDAMANAVQERGCDVTQSSIEFIDRRYAPRLSRFPMDNALWGVLQMLPAQLLRRTGEIYIAPEARAGGYDLVCVFSPTRWMTTSVLSLVRYLGSARTARATSECRSRGRISPTLSSTRDVPPPARSPTGWPNQH